MNYMCVTSHSLSSFAISLICLSIISKCIGLANFLSQIFVYMQSLCCCKRISMGFLCDAKKISENVFHWYFLSHKVYSNNCNIIIWSEWAFMIHSIHSLLLWACVCGFCSYFTYFFLFYNSNIMFTQTPIINQNTEWKHFDWICEWWGMLIGGAKFHFGF